MVAEFPYDTFDVKSDRSHVVVLLSHFMVRFPSWVMICCKRSIAVVVAGLLRQELSCFAMRQNNTASNMSSSSGLDLPFSLRERITQHQSWCWKGC